MSNVETNLTYRGFTLDPFQKEAVEYIDQNFSVLVAAPTGVGKTLIADYLIEKVYKSGGRVIYTAPIKALSNQKFKEFKEHMGEDAVGILTGDVVLNPDAPVLIMTTEIFRNMLQQSPARIADVQYIIFDEVHYIDDPQRGSVWEESLIFMPDTMRFLGLSATIPNVDQLAYWIGGIQNREVKIVTNFNRIVPLQHHLFEKNLGITNLAHLKKMHKRVQSKLAMLEPWERKKMDTTSHIDLIATIKKDYLPCLFFTFSRRKAEMNALQLGEQHDFLKPEQKKQVQAIIDQVVERFPRISSERWTSLRWLVLRGIGYHHAGMLPALKDIVEALFTHKLLSVLYCTETFAVGLNFPCRSVCFDSSTKWDGVAFRSITNREYFQMSGRAGRRGIDTEGFAFTLIDLNYFDPRDLPTMKESQIEPLQSQFTLSYNSILNLIKNYDDAQIYRLLGMNFATYQALDERSKVRENLAEMKTEIDAFCEHMDLEKCPLVYERLKRKRNQYQSQLGREQSGRRRKQRLQQQIAAINTSLTNIEMHNCSKEEQRKCRQEGKLYRKLLIRYQSLLKHERQLDPQERYYQEFQDKKSLLVSLNYLQGDALTTAGDFASQIHGQELLVTELFMDGLFHKLSIAEINAVSVAIGYEPRKNEVKIKHNLNFAPVYKKMLQLTKLEERFLGVSTVQFSDHIAALAYRWSQGDSFDSLMGDALIDEGDLVFAFRRGIDLIRQMRNATTEDKYLSGKFKECINKMDHDQVSIWL